MSSRLNSKMFNHFCFFLCSDLANVSHQSERRSRPPTHWSKNIKLRAPSLSVTHAHHPLPACLLKCYFSCEALQVPCLKISHNEKESALCEMECRWMLWVVRSMRSVFICSYRNQLCLHRKLMEMFWLLLCFNTKQQRKHAVNLGSIFFAILISPGLFSLALHQIKSSGKLQACWKSTFNNPQTV